MKDKRKKWIRPQLIVLGRGTPEENVLGGCKTTILSGSGITVAGCKSAANRVLCGTRTNCSTISTTS